MKNSYASVILIDRVVPYTIHTRGKTADSDAIIFDHFIRSCACVLAGRQDNARTIASVTVVVYAEVLYDARVHITFQVYTHIAEILIFQTSFSESLAQVQHTDYIIAC